MTDKTIKRKKRITFAALVALTFGAFIIAFLVGSSGTGIKDLYAIIFNTGDAGIAASTIFFKIRLPRSILAYLSGGALSIAGATLQGMFRNPMADSYLLGVSSGAAFGATIAIALGLGTALLGYGTITVFAFAGALLSMFMVYNIARVKKKTSIFSLLLSGIAISAFLSSIIYSIMIIARDKMEQIVMWTMGSFASATWDKLIVSGPVIVVFSAICLLYAKDLNIMLHGDEAARHLGVNTQRVRRNLLVVSTICAAATVSVSGIIGFVGLMIPHTLRLLIGPDHRSLLPFSFFGGGVFLLLADTIARIVIPLQEVPVGVITALCGVPFFLFLLRKGRKGGIAA